MNASKEYWGIQCEGELSKPLCVQARTPLRSDAYRGTAGLTRLRGGMEVSRLELGTNAPTLIEAGDESRPGFGCLIMLEGNIRLHPGGIDPLSVARGGVIMGLAPSDRTGVQLPVAARVRIVACGFPFDWFESLAAGPFEHQRELRRAMGGQPFQPFAVSLQRALRLQRLGEELFSNPYHGAAAHLFTEAKLLEIAASLMHQLSQRKAGPRAERARGSDRERLFEARDRLLADPAQPPTLAELAQLTGMNRNKLVRGFRELFGAAPAELLREARFELACAWLEERRMGVQEIAYRLGYAEPASFSHAFRRRFGVPPSRWPHG